MFGLTTLVAGGGIHDIIFQAILTNFGVKASIVLPLMSLLSKVGKSIFFLFCFPHPIFQNFSQHSHMRCFVYEYKAIHIFYNILH